jgi:putative ABC transport system permease protein
MRNLKAAVNSIRRAKMRSFLTMLGIVIGVASVVTIVSIGEGVRYQVQREVSEVGENLVTVRPGQLLQRDDQDNVVAVSIYSAAISAALSDNDWLAVKSTPSAAYSSPFNVVSGVVSSPEEQSSELLVVGVTGDVPELLSTDVEFGAFFSDNDDQSNVAVIGRRVAEILYGEAAPMGKTLTIRDVEFRVRGVFDQFPTGSLAVSSSIDYNSTVYIPYETSKEINDSNAQIFQILAKADSEDQTEELSLNINQNLLAVNDGQQNFTVLRQSENLAIANAVLTLLTGLVSGVAAISLLVGGIGIMNIMLVSVTERTREIGVRKSIGATNKQIFSQFITEAATLSFFGGVAGVFVALLANYALRIFTDLTPIITLPIVLASVGVALFVGTFFGVMPAYRAARKDPVQALRELT